MGNKEILLVSDVVGVGKVALSAMIPILSAMETKLNYLPTAVVSNNFGYLNVAMEDLTDFMEDTKNVWKDLGFRFDIITTGVVMNTKQVDIIKEIIDEHEVKPLVIADPIMGDAGQIYPGLSPDIVKASREIVLIADLIIPNITEAALILGEDYPQEMTHEIVVDWIEKLKKMGVKSSIITSVKVEDEYYVYGYSKEDEEIFRVAYKHIPIEFGGTGDIFAAFVTGKLANGYKLKESVEFATSLLSEIIEEESKGELKDPKEVAVEKYLNKIREYR